MSKLSFRNFKCSSSAFSAIEMLIYVAILAVIFVLAVNSILIIAKSFNKYRLSRIINTAAETAIERIIRETRLADDIDDAGSVFDSHPGRLKLSTIDPDTEIFTTMEFFASSTALMIKKGDASAIPLTSDNVLLTKLIFRKIASTSTRAVKIEIELKAERGILSKTEKFYSTIVLRRFRGE